MLSSIMWLLVRFYFILQQSDFIKELHPLATRGPKIMSLMQYDDMTNPCHVLYETKPKLDVVPD